MSDALSKEQRRNLRKEIGSTAAEAMAECRADVLKVRAAHLQMIDAVAAVDTKARKLDARVGAALKLGFDNEQAIGHERTHRHDLVARVNALHAFRDRGFWGRLKWIFCGR